ncbi:hypothetical protein CPB83DRAFT_834147 [Crepidotus variabilis]|uniref:Uncharacterized protein n=1 Tax=Crepidotus variabilis TaxID=179855 RepID=A0A9P6EL16_9AGAR|nr:hypothetical protein CPB83DRAFT_834147 [Crepidotus variabilis]
MSSTPPMATPQRSKQRAIDSPSPTGYVSCSQRLPDFVCRVVSSSPWASGDYRRSRGVDKHRFGKIVQEREERSLERLSKMNEIHYLPTIPSGDFVEENSRVYLGILGRICQRVELSSIRMSSTTRQSKPLDAETTEDPYDPIFDFSYVHCILGHMPFRNVNALTPATMLQFLHLLLGLIYDSSFRMIITLPSLALS